jgi:multiple sugar transport system substrate-binding protein
MLANSHFVQAYNDELQRMVTEWGRRRGVTARLDLIAERDMAAKLASEVEAKRGHDVVMLRFMEPGIYQENLADLSDVARENERQYGPYLDVARYIGFIGGRWVAQPLRYDSAIATINTAHWRKLGYEPDTVGHLTWDSFLDAAAALHAQGNPVGMAFSESFDATHDAFTMLWAFGARMADEQGRVTINSSETAAAIEYVKKLARYMPRDIVAWDEVANNRFMLSGVGSWTLNPPSIWASAKRDNLPIARDLDHVPVPAGPAGRFRTAAVYALGVWKFSPNVELAKDLIRYLTTKENAIKQTEASAGYNQPLLRGHRGAEVYKREPALRHYEPPVEEIRAWGMPAKPGTATGIAIFLFIVPTMFSRAIAGEATKDAITWAERQLTRIYGM